MLPRIVAPTRACIGSDGELTAERAELDEEVAAPNAVVGRSAQRSIAGAGPTPTPRCPAALPDQQATVTPPRELSVLLPIFTLTLRMYLPLMYWEVGAPPLGSIR